MKKLLFVSLILIMGTAMLVAADGEPAGNATLWQIISAVLAVLTGVLTNFMSKFRNKAKAGLAVGKEVLEAGQAGMNLVETVILAGDDNVIDENERKDIKNKALQAKTEWGDVKVAWKALWSKGI
ncbi:MAG: hypothetical protein V2B15_06515 [Bacteroidota bacterium]